MFRLSTMDVLGETGMLQAAEEAGAEVATFDEGEWVEIETDGHYLKKSRLGQGGA